MSETKKLRLGLIGAGEVAQVIHIPTMQLLDHLYSIVAICDISKKSADHCASKFRIPTATIDPQEIFTNPDIDVVFVLTGDEFHVPYTVAALQHGKHVFVEKPITLSIPSATQIVDAEKASKGSKVFVGYMRRYAPSFVNAFKREISTIPKILYARSRDIIGPNSHFVGQSGTFPARFTDFPPKAVKARTDLLDALFKECFEGQEVTPEKQKYCRFLGGLGSHDLSLMREALGGLPVSVAGVSVNEPFYSAIFNYRNRDGSPYAVTYESGIDLVPRFDAHLAVYGEKKTVSIHYDTP
jgi:predicted dehydrogenase